MPIVLTPRASAGGAVALPAPLRAEGGTVTIGRAAGADLVVAHPLVSSRHCTIVSEGEGWRLVDASTNGTLVNGRRVSGQQPLRHGDVIALGKVELDVGIEAGAGTAARLNLDDWGRGSSTSTPVAAAHWPAAAPSGDALEELLQAAGLDRGAVRVDEVALARTAGALLRASVEALDALVAERRRARRELGATASASAALTLADVLAAGPAAARDAAAQARRELDAHERAILAATQSAFRAALDQFAPAAIKTRARDDAAAWRAYEAAFTASDGFVDTFAKALASEYDRVTSQRP